MGKHKFSMIQRLALWKAYGERCAYSGEPLSFANLHIDHILPEILLDDRDGLERIRAEYGLSQAFDINSYDNWLPVHSRYNIQKGALVFDQPKTHFFLGIAEQHRSKVVALEEQIRGRMAKERVLLPVGAAIEAGLISAEDAIAYLNTLSEQDAFDLLSQLEFQERTVAGRISPQEAAASSGSMK